MNLGQNVYKPISFWSWNGDMREEEIRWQINEFKEKGFGGFFIHSRAGRLIPYMEKEWFRACQIAIDEAEKTGLDVWLYDEDGWPSGFAGGLVNGCGEDYCAKKLCFCTGTPKEPDTRILAVYRKETEGDYYRIETEQGTERDLYCYYQIVRHYVDIMDNKTIAKFIEVTHEKYKEQFGTYFGNVIKGIFTDEPQVVEGPCWSFCMEEKYHEKYGENILDNLWLMYIKGEGYQAIRYRFWQCTNDLVNKNFVCQINDWCNSNKLIFTGHFSYEDGLLDQTTTNGGVMPLYENMGMPGIDHLGNRFATAVLMKQVTSVAHQKEIPYVLCESFGCAGWGISFKELLGIAGWQAVFGVNTLCVHLSAYTITGRRKRDYPAFFSYQEPWWEDTGVLFEAIRRLNSEIAASTRETKVAVLHPIRSVWCESARADRYVAKALSAQFRELVDNLLDIHVDFDLLDETTLHTAVIEEGVIHAGAVSYTHFIIPETTTLSGDTVNMLEKFTKSGGKLLFVNGRPDSVEGDKGHLLVDTIRGLHAQEIQNTRYILQKYFRAYPIQDNIRLFDERLENEVTGLVSYYGKTEQGATLYLFNHLSGHEVSTIIRHKGRCKIEIVGLIDGSTKDITQACNGDCTYACVTIEAKSGALIRITNIEETEFFRNRDIGKQEMLVIDTIRPLEDNCLTLDTGRYQINGGAFSAKKAIIHMLDEIYSEIASAETESKVCIEYTFDANFKKMPEHLELAVEKADMLKITLNSTPILNEIGWWIDKGIMKYDISGLVVNGTNTVTLTYMIPSTGQVNNLKGKFESERNRFFYKVEPESIYICGNFDVRANVEMKENQVYYQAECSLTEEPVFTLIDATAKLQGDLTAQGMWFYRGACEYMGQLHYDGAHSCLLSIGFMQCINARVYVNGTYAGMVIQKSDELNITNYLQIGSNTISVVIAGHNRNLMGPHHHIRGAVHFVGQHTFMGVREFEDFVNPEVLNESTWTDCYSFVPFGMDKIIVKSLEK